MLVHKVNLEKDDLILVEIDPEVTPFDLAQNMAKNIQSMFPDNKVIFYLKGSKIYITKEKDVELIGEIEC